MKPMQRIYVFQLFLLVGSPGFIYSQAIDNTLAYRNIGSDRYFRIFYENDFFSGTDRDYTQGIYIEKVNPWFRKFPLTRLLWRPKFSDIRFGIAIEHDAYTPNFIDRPEIQYGDRPFAASLLLKTFLVASDFEKDERVSVSLCTGILGPGAGGEQMQKTIHHWINYTQPRGWHNQISNDVVLNYQLNFEKQIFLREDWLSFSTNNSIRLGTLSNKLSAGFEIMIGDFYSPFKGYRSIREKKFQWYIYEQPLINVVGYDATLQGGIFNHSSPYTIDGSALERFVFQHRYGVVLIFKKLYLEYYQTANTIEFKTSVYHHTGGLEFGFGF